MKTAMGRVVVLVVAAATAAGQTTLPDLRIVTVCEVLGDPARYAHAAIAIVGRADCEESLIDSTCFLAEDRCERPVVTRGYVWPTKVFLQWSEEAPLPPTERFQTDGAVLVGKLSLVRRSTKLGYHEKNTFKLEGGAIKWNGRAKVKDEWALAYGRVVFDKKRLMAEKKCIGAAGYSCGFGGAPLLLEIRPGRDSFLTLGEDGNWH